MLLCCVSTPGDVEEKEVGVMQNGHGHMWLLVTSTFSPATFFAASLLACGCVKDKWINMNHFDITSDIFRSVLCLHCERAEWDFIGTNFRRLVGRRRGGGTIPVSYTHLTLPTKVNV